MRCKLGGTAGSGSDGGRAARLCCGWFLVTAGPLPNLCGAAAVADGIEGIAALTTIDASEQRLGAVGGVPMGGAAVAPLLDTSLKMKGDGEQRDYEDRTRLEHELEHARVGHLSAGLWLWLVAALAMVAALITRYTSARYSSVYTCTVGGWVLYGVRWPAAATRGGHPVGADFSFENGENRVILRDRYISLDTQNTKNHHQSINLTRVVLHPRRSFLRPRATFSWRWSRAIFASLTSTSAASTHANARAASHMAL